MAIPLKQHKATNLRAQVARPLTALAFTAALAGSCQSPPNELDDELAADAPTAAVAQALTTSLPWATLTVADGGQGLVATSRGTVFALTGSGDVNLFEARANRWIKTLGSVRVIGAGGERLLARDDAFVTREWKGGTWKQLLNGPNVTSVAIDATGTAYALLGSGPLMMVNGPAGREEDWTVGQLGGSGFVKLLAGGSKVLAVKSDGSLFEQRGTTFAQIQGPGRLSAVTDDGTVYSALPNTSLSRWNGTSWELIPGRAPQGIFGRDRLLVSEGGRLLMLREGVWDDVGAADVTEAIVAGEVVISRGGQGSRRYVNTAGRAIAVTTSADVSSGSACSLRMAIRAAQENVTVGGCPAGSFHQEDVITVNPTTVSLDSGPSVSVFGRMAIVASGTGTANITWPGFTVHPNADLRVERLSLDGASAPALFVQMHAMLNLRYSVLRAGSTGGILEGGAAVWNEGQTTVMASKIIGSGSQGIARGGLIRNPGSMSILQSSLENGAAATGGCVHSAGQLNVYSSTLTNCTANVRGSALYLAGPTRIEDTTITGNRVNGSEGTIKVDSNDVIAVKNSIVAGNVTSGSCGDVCGSGKLTLFGTSLIGSTESARVSIASGTPIIGAPGSAIEPRLTRVDTSSTTFFELQFSSPARDAGNVCRIHDQIGRTRPTSGTCDIGSIETFN